MCLAIPMKVLAIDQFMARCEAKGVERDVSLFMIQNELVQVGDYVVVHVGYAIQKMTESDALTTWQIYDEMLELEAQAREATGHGDPKDGDPERDEQSHA